MDANFRWFEGEKAQFRFVPYDWAFLFSFGLPKSRQPMIGLFFLEKPRHILRKQADKEAGPDVKGGVSRKNKAGSADEAGQDERNSDI
jgi:hypothetical protein